MDNLLGNLSYIHQDGLIDSRKKFEFIKVYWRLFFQILEVSVLCNDRLRFELFCVPRLFSSKKKNEKKITLNQK